MKKYNLIEISQLEERPYSGNVYDLEVRDDHSYTVSNNIAVHNSACITRQRTGVGVPQLYALEQVYNASLSQKKPIPFIADGGISLVGDVAKALKFADAVMMGSIFSGTSETPGHVFENEHGEMYKTYGGSASGENKGENKFVEGVVKTVRFKGKVKYIIRKIKEGLQGACSYVGANNLAEFKENCEFVFLSSGSQKESKL